MLETKWVNGITEKVYTGIEVEVNKVKKYNSGSEYVISINGDDICICKSKNRVNKILDYITNGNDSEMNDDSVKKIIDKVLKEF